MTKIHDDTTITLDGINPFGIGGDTYTWLPRNFDLVDISGNMSSPVFEVKVQLTGSNWALSTLQVVGSGMANVSITDLGGGTRDIDFLRVAGRYSNTVTLQSTSVEFIFGSAIGDSVTLGTGLIGTLNTNNGNDTVRGGRGSVDSILLGDGDDTFTSGVGGVRNVDAGEGDDRLILVGDVLTISTGGGNDTVTRTGSGVTHTLDTDDGNDQITVKAGSVKVIRAGDGDNTINLASGITDTISAGAGNDRLTISNKAEASAITLGSGDNYVKTGDGFFDSIVGGAGYDAVVIGAGGGGSVNVGYGNNVVTTGTGRVGSIISYDGNDTVRLGVAGAGSILLNGGNDTVVLSKLAQTDQVVHIDGGVGTDTISFSGFDQAVTVSLGTGNVTTQSGTFVFSAFENVSGGSGNDVLMGNALSNLIQGGAGVDRMQGFAGNDIYYVDQANDVVIEMSGGGVADRVLAAVSYQLAPGSEIEALATVSIAQSTAINLTGNEFVQTITGNAGDNVLNGKGGSDTLIGLGGTDTFVFDTTLGANNVDIIVGYSAADDTIALSKAIFTGLSGTLGELSPDQFVSNATGAASDADDRVIYQANTGRLFYDADGLNGADAIQFAAIAPNLTITSADFFLV